MNTATKDSYSALSGIEKAAVVMLTISEENIAKIFSMMEEDEIKDLSHMMSQLGSIKSEIVERILNEFTAEMSQNVSFVGNMETTERILVKSLGREMVDNIMDEIRGPAGKNIWEKLANVNEELLASFLKNEYPQTVALVMTKVSPAHAARVLSVLPEELTFEVMMRMLTMDSVKKEMLDGIERTLRAEFINNLSRTQKLDSNELMAEIFNNFDRASETKYMTLLEEGDPESAERIKSLMFTFDDLSSLDGQSVQVIMRKIDKTLLPLAMKGASEELKKLFMDNMSTRAAKILEEDIESLGPVKLRDVDEAQSKLVLTAKELAASGEITIDSGGEDIIY